MTYTKLIERLDTELLWTLNYEAQDAIQALQEKNALLEGTLESRERNIAEMQAENERLNKNNGLIYVEVLQLRNERDALQSKVNAMGKGEPVAYRAWFDADNGARWLFTLWPEEEKLAVEWEPLYEAPKALEPLTDDELWKFWWSRPEVPEGEDESMEAQFVAAARSILAAHGITKGTP